MPVPKQTRKLNLDLNQIPSSRQADAKRDVGEFVVGEILRAVSSGRSPVEGRGAFQKLDIEYAIREKGGNRTPNLELQGDMLDSLTFENIASGVEVGIFVEDEQDKADGHNNFSGESRLPTRRFIPSPTENFNRTIERGVDRILNRYREVETPEDPLGLANSLLTLGAAAAAATLANSAQDITIDDITGSLGGGLFE